LLGHRIESVLEWSSLFVSKGVNCQGRLASSDWNPRVGQPEIEAVFNVSNFGDIRMYCRRRRPQERILCYVPAAGTSNILHCGSQIARSGPLWCVWVAPVSWTVTEGLRWWPLIHRSTKMARRESWSRHRPRHPRKS
jgi:hypothetical protein